MAKFLNISRFIPESFSGELRHAKMGKALLEGLVPEYAFETYIGGISFAEQHGLITRYASSIKPERAAFSHLENDGKSLRLRLNNTSGVNVLPGTVAQCYAEFPAPRFLELGAGSGLAASMFKRLVPHAELDTVGMTPINPFLQFRRDFDRMNPPEGLSEIFERTEIPFISHQHIGQFPKEIQLPHETYHMIFDCYGPLQKCVFGSRWGLNRRIAVALEQSVQSLRPDGVLFVAAVSELNKRFYETLLTVGSGNDPGAITIAINSLRTFIHMRSDAPLAKIVGEGGVFTYEELLRKIGIDSPK